MLRRNLYQYSRYQRRFWSSSSFFKVRINAAKITLTFAIMGALFLSLLDLRKQPLTESIRNTVVDHTLPIIQMGLELTSAVTAEIRGFVNPSNKYQEVLNAKDKTIHYWKLEVQRLRNEIHSIKNLLQYKNDLKTFVVTGQLIIPAGHQMQHKGILNIGSRSGIQKNAVVVSPQGLVGKVQRVGNKTAEVMLLNHALSAVPVYVERTNAIGVLKGDAHHGLRLDYLDVSTLENGDRLLTSGQGGIFPRGINVAAINKKENNTYTLHLMHTLQDTLYVYVLSSGDRD